MDQPTEHRNQSSYQSPRPTNNAEKDCPHAPERPTLFSQANNTRLLTHTGQSNNATLPENTANYAHPICNTHRQQHQVRQLSSYEKKV